MLEENMRDWARKARREVRVKTLRKVLLDLMAVRFGRLSLPTRRRVEGITSTRELEELARRVVSAQSLQDMQLG